MKKDRSSIRRIVLQSFRCGLFIVGGLLSETMTAQNRAVVFDRDFSPAEGLVIPQEKPYRDEVCLNDFGIYNVLQSLLHGKAVRE